MTKFILFFLCNIIIFCIDVNVIFNKFRLMLCYCIFIVYTVLGTNNKKIEKKLVIYLYDNRLTTVSVDNHFSYSVLIIEIKFTTSIPVTFSLTMYTRLLPYSRAITYYSFVLFILFIRFVKCFSKLLNKKFYNLESIVFSADKNYSKLN